MKTIIKMILVIAIAFIFCMNIDYTSSKIINQDTLFTLSVDVFGIVLAITAIFFTVVDRYKEKNENKRELEIMCFPILKEMCENVLGILIIVIIMFIMSALEPLLLQIKLPEVIKNVQIVTFIFFASFSLVLLVLFDITKSIMDLVKGIFLSPKKSSEEKKEKHQQFMEMCKTLNDKNFSELINYTKTLIVKQKIEDGEK